MFADRGRLRTTRQSKKKAIFLAAVSGLFVLSLFQNCANHDDGMGVGGLGSANCSAHFKAAFNSSVYPFVVTNCAGCHVPGGGGKQAFADSDPSNAWSQFSVISNAAAKIYNNSVSTSHAPGITGSQLESSASGVRQALESAESTCLQSGGGGVAGVAVYTTAKVIDLDVGSTRTIFWKLDEELSRTVNTNGALLFVDIQAATAQYYVLSRPRIRTGSQDLYVKTLKVIINGQVVDLATLFTSVDKTIPAWTNENVPDGMLSEQAETVPVEVNNNDTIAIGFDALDRSGN